MGAVAYDSFSVVLAAAALRLPTTLVVGKAGGMNRANSIFGVTIPAYQNGKFIAPLGLMISSLANFSLSISLMINKGVNVINEGSGQ